MSSGNNPRNRVRDDDEKDNNQAIDVKRCKSVHTWNISVLNSHAFAYLSIEEVARLMSVCKSWCADVLAMPRNFFRYYMNDVYSIAEFDKHASRRIARHFPTIIRFWPEGTTDSLQTFFLRCKDLPHLHTIELSVVDISPHTLHILNALEHVNLAPLQVLSFDFYTSESETFLLQLIQLAGRCSTLKTLTLHAGPSNVINVMELDLRGLRFHPTLSVLDMKHIHVSLSMAEHILTIPNLHTIRIASTFDSSYQFDQPRLSVVVAKKLAQHPSLCIITDLLPIETHITRMVEGWNAHESIAPFSELSLFRTQHPPAPNSHTLLSPWKQTLTKLSITTSEDICSNFGPLDYGLVLTCVQLTDLSLVQLDCNQQLVDLLAQNLQQLQSLHLERGSLDGLLTFNGFPKLNKLALYAMDYRNLALGHASKDELIHMLTSNARITDLDISGSFYTQATNAWGPRLSEEMDEFIKRELGIPCARLPLLVELAWEFVCEY